MVANERLNLDHIVEAFDFLPDWEHRYQFLDELGEMMDPMNKEDMRQENLVPPCMSTVYVAAKEAENDPEKIRFDGFCDTPTIRGVIAVLVALFSNKTPEEVVLLDTDAVFVELSLFENLSPTRHVGVYAIVEKMKSQARVLLEQQRTA